MSDDPSQTDDPTRALDDFVRRMRPSAAPVDSAPDLSDLVARLRPDQGNAKARPKGGRLRGGQTWDAGDVEDVPIIELPRPRTLRSELPELDLPAVDMRAEQRQAAQRPEIDLPPAPASQPEGGDDILAAVEQARAQAASQQRAELAAQAAPAWQPDLTALQLRRASDPRLLSSWQPGAWIGAVRQVFEGTTEFLNTPDGSPTVQTWPAHRLLLLWPPLRLDAPAPGRWPARVRLSAVAADEAGATLLAELPEGAPLWLPEAVQDIDWALAAEIVLHHEPTLRPFQIDGLRAFVAAEREASYTRLNADYRQPAAGAAVQRG